MSKANQTAYTMSQEAPMITPPAKVALRTSSMSNLPSWNKADVANAPVTEAVKAITVLTTTLYWAFPLANTQLNEGQKQNKKTVPTIAMSCEL